MAPSTVREGDTNLSALFANNRLKAHLTVMGHVDVADAIPLSRTFTKASVKGATLFQKLKGLDEKGFVGPETWAELRRTPFRLIVVPRGMWGARAPRKVTKVSWRKNSPTRVHHSVTRPPRPAVWKPKSLLHRQERAHMREIQNFHIDKRDYDDIGYNYVIMPSGVVYQGRGREVEGAHTLGHNNNPGICFAGNYEQDKLTWAQIRAYQDLRSVLDVEDGIAYAHKATYSTACPGKNIISVLKLRT